MTSGEPVTGDQRYNQVAHGEPDVLSRGIILGAEPKEFFTPGDFKKLTELAEMSPLAFRLRLLKTLLTESDSPPAPGGDVGIVGALRTLLTAALGRENNQPASSAEPPADYRHKEPGHSTPTGIAGTVSGFKDLAVPPMDAITTSRDGTDRSDPSTPPTA